MGSDWVYFTDVRPLRKRTDGEDGNTEYKTEFNKAFDIFSEDCKIPISKLEQYMKKDYCGEAPQSFRREAGGFREAAVKQIFRREAVKQSFRREAVYVHTIRTDKDNDSIVKGSNYHVKFLKSKFLDNAKFKRGLIDYYNPAGFFIKGPSLVKEDEWMFEITRKIGY